MDETVINGANLFFPKQFGIDPNAAVGGPRNQWLLGVVNSAPYVSIFLFLFQKISLILLLLSPQLCCAVLGCWLTEPLNNRFGRRGTVFIAATICAICCVWQAVTNSWGHLFVRNTSVMSFQIEY